MDLLRFMLSLRSNSAGAVISYGIRDPQIGTNITQSDCSSASTNERRVPTRFPHESKFFWIVHMSARGGVCEQFAKSAASEIVYSAVGSR